MDGRFGTGPEDISSTIKTISFEAGLAQVRQLLYSK